MVAQGGISTSRGVRSSARRDKDTIQKEGQIKMKALENGKIDRKKVIEKKLPKDIEMKSDLTSDMSVTANKGSAKTNLLKNKDGDQRAKSSSSKDRHERTNQDRKHDRTNGRSESERKRKEKLEKTKGDAKLSDERGKRKRGHEASYLVCKNTSKLEGSDEVDFSQIESKIFENQPSVEKKKSSGRGKEKVKEGVRSKDVPRSGMSKALKNGKDNKKVSKGESAHKSRRTPTVKKGRNKEQQVDGSDSDASDWEEVEDGREEINELEALLDDSQDVKLLAKQSVKIELDAPDVIWGMKKRKKRRTEEEMIEEYLRKSVNRSIKEVYENMHKTHLLCLFSHGQYVNKSLNSDILLGAALSMITDKNAYPPKRLDMNYLEKFVSWFLRKVTVKNQDLEDDYWSHPLEDMLVKRFENKIAFCNRELVYMFVILCRALGMNVRLIISLQPMSWKPTAGALIKRLKEEKKVSSINEPSCSKSIDMCVIETKVKEEKPKVKNNRKMLSSDSDVEMKVTKGKKKSSKDNVCIVKPPPNKKSKMSSSFSDDNDSDFDPSVKVKKGPKAANVSKKRNSGEGSSGGGTKRKMNEKDDKKEGKRKKAEPLIEWVEIYVEEEEKWMCVDITKGKIHCIPEIEARTPTSSAHITAFNVDLTVKDVTRRYIASWLSNENKVRCCSKWWGKIMRAFKGRSSRRDKEEDEEMDQNLRQQPLPKVIGEYKNHPLYALQRHLLKFESLYPPDEAPVGYIKGEPVYSRESVYTLRSRDTWMKEAKTVRVGEEPYKVVKARPKWDRDTCQVIKDRPLELFGEWQVEDFEPPVATNGKVPRNEYGNVELFKPTMLPKGCVHLPIAGLNRIARKLNIDCAPAMIGFDFHSGWTHPVYEGYVVCEEFKDTLLDAWNEDQVEQARREKEKQEKRIYNNWKKLIHGMMVRERVREKYGNSLPPEGETEGQSQEVDSKESEAQVEGKKGNVNKKNNQKKSKVTQEDIDAERPSMVTHKVRNLKIDLTSNVVDMAKESRKSTMKTNNTVKAKSRKGKGKSSQPLQKEGDLDDSSEESEDEEEKKARIRAILQWGTRAANENPNLSDDSDNEGNSRPTSSKLLSLPSHWQTATTTHMTSSQKNNKKRNKKLSKSEEVSDISNASSRSPTPESDASSRSTTPECYVDTGHDKAPRKGLQRSAKRKTVKYEESDDGDISLDESDVDDKTYNPSKNKSDNFRSKEEDFLNLSESD